jgi:hypothetical protein
MDVTGAVAELASTVEDRIRRIVALHEAGDLGAAARELRALRRTQPDADRRLPAELHDWAAAVPQDP